MLQRIDLADRVALASADELQVDGFAGDTLVTAGAAGARRRAPASSRDGGRTITKRVPVAAGLGGGSSDAATALLLANATLPEPLDPDALHELAAGVGADVPFFLRPGPQLGEGDGTTLRQLELPQDFWVVLVLPRGARKASTSAVYASSTSAAAPRATTSAARALLEALARLRRAA